MEKYGRATPEALVESAVWEASLFEEHGFSDFKISVKHHDPVVMVRAYELLAERDRKSTRLNSSHVAISYAVFCLKKKKIYKLVTYDSSDVQYRQVSASR